MSRLQHAVSVIDEIGNEIEFGNFRGSHDFIHVLVGEVEILSEKYAFKRVLQRGLVLADIHLGDHLLHVLAVIGRNDTTPRKTTQRKRRHQD